MLDDIKKNFVATADKLSANMGAADYKHLVLGEIFLKYISDTFAARRANVVARVADPADEYFYGGASAEDLAAEADDHDYYTSVNVFWVTANVFLAQTLAALRDTLLPRRISGQLRLPEATEMLKEARA